MLCTPAYPQHPTSIVATSRPGQNPAKPFPGAHLTPAKRARQEAAAGQPRHSSPSGTARQLHLSLPPKQLVSQRAARPFTPTASRLQAGALRELAAAQTPHPSRPGSAAARAAYAAGASDLCTHQILAHRHAAACTGTRLICVRLNLVQDSASPACAPLLQPTGESSCSCPLGKEPLLRLAANLSPFGFLSLFPCSHLTYDLRSNFCSQ